MVYLTVSQLAKILEVTPQGINKFMREQGLQSQAVKKGNKFLINETLAETIRNHFRPNDVDLLNGFYKTETKTEILETNTKTTETEMETNGNDKTPGQTAFYNTKIEQLEIRLKEKDSEIEFLRNELKDSREIQKQLAAQNTVFTTKYLVEASKEQDKESDSTIDVDIQETEEKGSAADATHHLDSWKNLTRWERIKRAWKGEL